jgi:glycosyltransferase involved in cell wall biosynthesis
MKILVVSTNAITTPPVDGNYAGIEAIVWNFCELAPTMGHEVILATTTESQKQGNYDVFAENDVEKKNRVGSLSVRGYGYTGWNLENERQSYLNYKDMLENEFGEGQGVVIDHSWWGYPYLSLTGFAPLNVKPHPKMKIMHVHHGESNWFDQTTRKYVMPNTPYPRMLGVSKVHASHLSNLFGVPFRYINNGINMPPKPEPVNDGYLLSLNRFTPEKGIHNSIDVALATGHRIICAGDERYVPDQNYVYDMLERCEKSGGQAEFLGHVTNERKWDLLKNCKAVIACTETEKWIEAFGLYQVEAGAMGKPFVGVPNGGTFDIIENGVNGILASTPEKLKDAIRVGQIDSIEADRCREMAERFTAKNMTLKYLEVCEKVLADDPSYRW